MLRRLVLVLLFSATAAAQTPNMLLDKPTVGVTTGPQWATKLNDALDRIDSHDHSPGKGTKITPAGINITGDLEFNGNNATELRASRYIDQVSTLGSSEQGQIYNVAGNLYWNNSTGTPVQLTSGSSIVSSISGAFSSFTPGGFPYSVTGADAQRVLQVDTSAARTVNLPAATTQVMFMIKDITGSAATNNITVVRSGSDTIDGVGANRLLRIGYGSWIFISNGSTNWNVMQLLPESTALTGYTDIGTSSVLLQNVYSKAFAGDVATSLSAAGGTLAAATALPSFYNQTTGGSAGQGVKLPTTTPIGGFVILRQNVAATLKLYPPNASDSLAFDGVVGSPGVGFDIYQGKMYIAFKVTATAWHLACLNNLGLNQWLSDNLTGHLAPLADLTYNLGSTAKRVLDVMTKTVNGTPPPVYATANGGAANAYTATASSVITTLTSGQRLTFVANHTNTASPTMNLNSLGALEIRTKRDASMGLGSSAIVSGGTYTIVYDGTVWRMTTDDEGLKTCTPTYGATGSMTFTSVTTYVCEYRQIGKRVTFKITAAGTTGGVASSGLTATLPVTPASSEDQMALAAFTAEGGSALGASGVLLTAGNIARVLRYDGGNYGLGSGRYLAVSGTYEAQ